MESNRSKTFVGKFFNIKEKILFIPEAYYLREKIADLISFNEIEKLRQWSEK